MTQHQIEVIATLTEAISNRKQISFVYKAPGDNLPGLRYGNPHAVYYHTPKSEPLAKFMHLDLVQLRGPSKSGGLPGWRCYKIDCMYDVSIVEDDNEFLVNIEYKPYSDRYRRTIIKIELPYD